MEKKMKKIKKEIKTQNRFYLIIAALFLIAQCTNTSGVLTSAYTNPHSAEFVHGFVLGLVIVVLVSLCLLLIWLSLLAINFRLLLMQVLLILKLL